MTWASLLPEMWKALLTGVIAPSALLLGQWLIRRSRRPKLVIDSPDGHGWRVADTFDVPCDGGSYEVDRVWLRVRVRNAGSRTAKNCQVFLMQYGPPGAALAVADGGNFDPSPLIWAHSEHLEEDKRIVTDLPPGVHRFADLALAVDAPETTFALRSPTRDDAFAPTALRHGGLCVDLLVVDGDGNSDRRTLTFLWNETMESLQWRRDLLRSRAR